MMTIIYMQASPAYGLQGNITHDFTDQDKIHVDFSPIKKIILCLTLYRNANVHKRDRVVGRHTADGSF
jgi:hypothetical protein